MIQLFFCFLIAIFTLYKIAKWRHQRKGRIIPGPEGLPLIGCAHKVPADKIHFKFMEFAEKYGEIFQLKMFVNNLVVLNSESLLRKAFGDDKYRDFFNDRAQMYFGHHFRCRNQSMGLISDGAGIFHKTARKEFARGIHVYGSGLQELEDNVMTEMKLLVKRIENMPVKEFECLELFRRSLTNVISLVLSGDVIDDESADISMMWHHVYGADFFLNSKNNLIMKTLPFMRFLPGRFRTEYERCRLAHERILQRYFYDMKKSHVSGNKRGLVDHYLDVQKNEMASGKAVIFTDERIIAQIIETIDAGIATTWSLLTSSMLALINFPENQAKIQEELDSVIGRERLPKYTDRGKCTFLKAFGMEVHRYLTVSPLLVPHYCRKSLEFEGYDIKPDTMVFGNVWYIHHNKEIWGDPWTFRPERFLDEHGNILPNDHKLMKNYLPFSYGQRQCPGMIFAQTRYFLYLATLLQRWNFDTPDGKKNGCDPRNPDVYDLRLLLKPKPFSVCARERVK